MTRSKEAYCGLYCGACPVFLKRGDDWIVQHVLEQFGIPLKDLRCEGCRSGVLSPSCEHCAIRDCAQSRGLDSCAPCSEFPCGYLSGFGGTRPHGQEAVPNLRAIRDEGSEKWLADQANHWTCAQCRRVGSWYEQACPQCGADLPASWAKPE